MQPRIRPSLLVLALLVSGCGRIGYEASQASDPPDAAPTPDAPQETWWHDDWAYRVRLTLDARGIADDLKDFPVLVTLSDEVVPYAKLQDLGQDLRFVASDDVTVLAHEIDTWAPGDRSQVWVRVPFIAADSKGDFIWLYYGNPNAADEQRAGEVWADMHAVWHLGDPEAQGFFADSANGYHAQADLQNTDTAPVGVLAPIGEGLRFDGIDDVIPVAGSDSFNFTEPGLTIEAWLRYDSLQAPWNNYIGMGGYTNGYRLGISEQGVVGFQITGELYDLEADLVPTLGEWHYIVGTWDGVKMRLYVDGVADPAELERPGNFDATNANFALGIAQYPYPGDMDEVRVSNLARSAAWIEAQYRSMTGGLVVFEVQ
ncbi:DUF2341 domain-containing protein [Haliangium sp.]|uniref:DUF2341 domain-containing protein n=1 Tax=Haliangium sp. TaxID=2663208 RepID=UPI003D0B58FC